MIETYAEAQLLEAQEPRAAGWMLATVGAVDASGITLIFPGQTEAGTKKYKSNTAITFTAGQRVLVARDSGTCIVVCPVG